MVKIKIEIPCKDGPDNILLNKNSRTREDIEKLEKEDIALVHILYCPDNKLTLTQFGNKAIEECKDEYDYLILMHSDVDISIYDFVKQLLKNKEKYDIVGLAGTKKLFISQTPLTWFTGSNKYQNERYGRITHNHNGMMLESFFNREKPDVFDTEVITIDGLLMCLNKKTMQNEKARFDEQFTYDFYDLDFCINAQVNTDLKIGVFIMPAIHNSLGKSVLTEEYLIPERKFRAKWNDLVAGNKEEKKEEAQDSKNEK